MEFNKNDFQRIEDIDIAKAVFKLAAFNKIQNSSSSHEKRDLSIQYQVLCEETAIIGVKKQKNKSTGEVKESVVEFGESDGEEEEKIQK